MGGSTIWLVGMMGAGKTAVGRALAERLGVPFLDSDAEIEREAERSVSEIFEGEGEAAFRALERRAIDGLAGRPAVVALGGGAIAQPGMADRLAQSGTVVYLRARVETLVARVGDGATRPLLAGLDADARRARLGELLAEREGHYASAALVVDADVGSPDEVAARVERALEGGEGT